MKALLLLIFFAISMNGYGQQNDKISTMDFVEILNGNHEEATYYYQNNWKVLRTMAMEKGYIHSFQILEAPASEEAPFQLMLVTTYLNEKQYALREDHFSELIKEKGALLLLNDKKPGDFRKTVFNKERVRHWK